VIVFSIAGLLLSLGLCGLGLIEGRNIHDGAPGTYDILGAVGLVASLFCLIAGVTIAVIERFAKPSGSGDK